MEILTNKMSADEEIFHICHFCKTTVDDCLALCNIIMFFVGWVLLQVCMPFQS